MTRWLVITIGCLECGIDSDVVGVYATRDEAERVKEVSPCSSDYKTEIFEIEVPE